jgi:hypothetical protein
LLTFPKRNKPSSYQELTPFDELSIAARVIENRHERSDGFPRKLRQSVTALRPISGGGSRADGLSSGGSGSVSFHLPEGVFSFKPAAATRFSKGFLKEPQHVRGNRTPV